MDRIYRIEWKGDARHAVERDGVLSLVRGDIFGRYKPERRVAEGSGTSFTPAVRVLAPVVPGKIVGIGLNYKDHAAEQGKPLPVPALIFLKPSTAVIAPGEAIRLPRGAGRIDHEAEMALVIGRRATRVPVGTRRPACSASPARTTSRRATCRTAVCRYSHVKGFDTFAPLGPCISIGLDCSDLAVEGWVNGVRRQGSRTSQLVFPAAELIAYISAIMTLEPGDVISTGTPSGIGGLRAGDVVTVTVEGGWGSSRTRCSTATVASSK